MVGKQKKREKGSKHDDQPTNANNLDASQSSPQDFEMKLTPAMTTKEATTTSDNGQDIAGEPTKMNARERRMLKRKLARAEGKEESQTIAVVKKKNRNSAKVVRQGAENTAKKIHLTLFLGQLPYNATEECIRKHFEEAGDIKIRMLTNKKTKKFKGTAFIEVKDSKALGAALSRHHSLLNGRRINVELTANGGGNRSELRLQRIKTLREKQRAVQTEKAKVLLRKRIEDPFSIITEEDVDDRVIDFLSWFDYETAKKAVQEFETFVTDSVDNRKAYFMGILKRFRSTDGVEEDKQSHRRGVKDNQRAKVKKV